VRERLAELEQRKAALEETIIELRQLEAEAVQTLVETGKKPD